MFTFGGSDAPVEDGILLFLCLHTCCCGSTKDLGSPAYDLQLFVINVCPFSFLNVISFHSTSLIGLMPLPENSPVFTNMLMSPALEVQAMAYVCLMSVCIQTATKHKTSLLLSCLYHYNYHSIKFRCHSLLNLSRGPSIDCKTFSKTLLLLKTSLPIVGQSLPNRGSVSEEGM